MKKLLIEIDKALEEYGLKPVSDIINNQKKSAEYVHEMLVNRMGLLDIKPSKLQSGFANRINHCLFTFALGVLLAKFLDLNKKIENHYKKYFSDKSNVFLDTWLVMSLYHDYGYFLFSDYKDIHCLNDFNVNYDIFNYYDEINKVNAFFGFDVVSMKNVKEHTRYSRELYENYFRSSYKNTRKTEPYDHGIAGGYVLFNDLISYFDHKKIKNNDSIRLLFNDTNNFVNNNLFYQNICFRIMEHNIWKIDINDPFFKDFPLNALGDIIGENFKKISIDEPLLYLLSLVDTMEFIKKIEFSYDKESSNWQNKRIKTIANLIEIEIDNEKLVLYTTKLKLWDKYLKWYEGIETLNSWVNIDIAPFNGEISLIKNDEFKEVA